MSFQAACFGLCAILYSASWIVIRVKRLLEPAAPSHTVLLLGLTYALLAMGALK